MGPREPQPTPTTPGVGKPPGWAVRFARENWRPAAQAPGQVGSRELQMAPAPQGLHGGPAGGEKQQQRGLWPSPGNHCHTVTCRLGHTAIQGRKPSTKPTGHPNLPFSKVGLLMDEMIPGA